MHDAFRGLRVNRRRCSRLVLAMHRAYLLARLDPLTDLKCTRLMEMRRHWNIPDSYPGNVMSATTNSSTLQKMADENLGPVASQSRSRLDLITLKHAMRVHVTSIALGSSRSASPPTIQSRSIIMSSWSTAECYDLDFGFDLGAPTSLRRPQSMPIEGSIILLPKAPDGEMVAGVSLRNDDMEKLKMDDEFMKYAEYIG